MEDVLDLYAEAPDPERPVVCFDESPVQLIGEARQPIPVEPGRIERYDYEYRRKARSISSSSSTCIVPGARSKSPNGERQRTRLHGVSPQTKRISTKRSLSTLLDQCYGKTAFGRSFYSAPHFD
jgi:hypothetical protein